MRTCNAYHVRLGAGADPEKAARCLAEITTWWPASERPRLWHEVVPGTSAEDAGRLRRELNRPVAQGGPMLRAVLLSYAGQQADLVLVAHDSVLDAASLRVIGRAMTGELAAEPVNFARSGERSACERLDWTSGAPGTCEETGVAEVPLPGNTGDVVAGLAVAVSVVISRYQSGQVPTVSVPGPSDGEILVRPDLSGTVADAFEKSQEPGESAAVGILADALHADDGRLMPATSWPFTLVPRRENGTLTLSVQYRTDTVDAAYAHRFARHVAHVYRHLGDPALRAGEISLLDRAELEYTLALGMPSGALSWSPQRIDTAFRDGARRRGDAVALVCGKESMTYRALDDRSDRMAAGLAALGTRPGDRVGVCLERSIDLVAALLAVLKAGAVYVPMDPAYPDERLAYTTEDAALSTVITDRADFPARCRATPAELAASTGPVPRGAGNPEDPAYVIYTSGSTGRPKGVVVPHRNVLALLAATREDFALSEADTWTLFHSGAFDFSVWEIWGALLTGARLVVVPYWVSRSPEDFHALLVSEGVTVLNQTPSAFAQLSEADAAATARPPLRLVVFGGEPLDTGLLPGWFDRHPESRCRVVNMFGITETTVHVTAQTVTRRDAVAGSRSVGRPIPGWHVHILDERGAVVPVGVPGEIYVGGEGVALGYLGRDELTAERFRPDPDHGGRLYRSGDAGRLLPDGRIEHLGRLDNQVKVRGFRIELDEIRSVLLGEPEVTAAAVVVSGTHDAAATRLDAYVVLVAGHRPDWTDALRERAARSLPGHMLPATFTAVPELPLTVNGKLDASRLPPPESAPAPPVPAVDGDGLTRDLVEVWRSVLGVDVGPDDNFFALGGNSLVAVRVRTAMRERGMPELALRQVYLTPTVRQLAAALSASHGGHGEEATTEPGQKTGPLAPAHQ